ncbi:hypothetical protein NM208_g8968 [Fusarium decemcellulare]|uniref:Uncharacterized protein n=1 Tax=Fusarium decemcellulare TaxID=57161 RepID=A0ACC1S3H9_9HYPO|nr:hypothetical protein NM208_g8968 [Fusarium decemcellulare]
MSLQRRSGRIINVLRLWGVNRAAWSMRMEFCVDDWTKYPIIVQEPMVHTVSLRYGTNSDAWGLHLDVRLVRHSPNRLPAAAPNAANRPTPDSWPVAQSGNARSAGSWMETYSQYLVLTLLPRRIRLKPVTPVADRQGGALMSGIPALSLNYKFRINFASIDINTASSLESI